MHRDRPDVALYWMMLHLFSMSSLGKLSLSLSLTIHLFLLAQMLFFAQSLSFHHLHPLMLPGLSLSFLIKQRLR